MQAGDIERHWLINAVSATVPAQTIGEIAAREDVKKVWLDKEIRLIEPVDDIGDGYSTMVPNDDMMINPILNYSGDSLDQIIEVSTVNHTPPSLVDEVAASDSIRLYLRPDPTPPHNHYLSEYPETSVLAEITMYANGYT